MKNVNVNSESVNNVVNNAAAAEQIFAQAVKDGKEKSVHKTSQNVGDENTANSLEKSVTIQRSWLIYAEREIAPEIKAVATEHFAKVLLGGESVQAARWTVLRLVGAKLMQDGASKGRKMFKATLRKVVKDMQESGVYQLPTAATLSETRKGLKEYAKQLKAEAEAKAQRAKIEAIAKNFGISFETAENMFKAGVFNKGFEIA